MAITAQTPYNSYSGNGSTTVFPYTFKVFTASDMKVYLDGVLTTAYTISGVGVDVGGNITFTSAPASGVAVLANREIPYDRQVDYQTSGDLLADTLDADLDRIESQIQQLSALNGVTLQSTLPLAAYDAHGREIINLGSPTTGGSAVNKTYLDAALAGYPYNPTFITSIVYITADTTITDAVIILPGGGYNISSGKTLTINGPFSCPLYQCFQGSGAITFGVGAVSEVYPEWWGKNTTPGTTDMTAAIRSALDAGPVRLAKVVYGVDDLQLKTGDVLIGSGSRFWQTPGAKPTGTHETILKYIGAGGANSVVVRAAVQSVGDTTQPAVGQDTFSWKLTDVIIDGNDTAEFGLYGARCGLGTVIDRVVLTGCTEFGGWINHFWTAEIRSLFAIFNGGRGFALGHNTFGWAASAINAVSINTIQAFENGNDLTDWTQADYLEGYGMYLGLGRGCVAENLIGEYNSGVGIIVAPTAGANIINGYYCENNCNIASSAEDRYQLWYESVASSANTRISNGYYLYNVVAPSGNDNAPRIRITGTPNTAKEAVPIFDGWQGGAVINADFGDYRLENIGLRNTTRIISHLPKYNDSDTITLSGGGWTSTIYVNETATGTGSGIDTSNYALWGTALNVIKGCSSITTIDNSSITSSTGIVSAPVIDGTGITQRIVIEGGTTGRLPFIAASARGATIQNWYNELTIKSQALTEFLFVKDSKLVLNDNVLMRMNVTTTSGAALDVDNSQVQITGTSAISVSGSGTSTKVGINASGGSIIWFTGDATSVISGESASSNVVIADVSAVKDSTGWRLSTF